MNDFTPEQLFTLEQDYEDGWPVGTTTDQLADAIGIWFYSHGTFGDGTPLTVGVAAKAFALPADFVARAIDHRNNPFFFACPADDPADRLLDCDGL